MRSSYWSYLSDEIDPEILAGECSNLRVLAAIAAVDMVWAKLDKNKPFRKSIAVDILLRNTCGMRPRLDADEAKKVGQKVAGRVTKVSVRLAAALLGADEPTDWAALEAVWRAGCEDVYYTLESLRSPDSSPSTRVAGMKRALPETGAAALPQASPLSRMPLSTLSETQPSPRPALPGRKSRKQSADWAAGFRAGRKKERERSDRELAERARSHDHYSELTLDKHVDMAGRAMTLGNLVHVFDQREQTMLRRLIAVPGAVRVIHEGGTPRLLSMTRTEFDERLETAAQRFWDAEPVWDEVVTSVENMVAQRRPQHTVLPPYPVE